MTLLRRSLKLLLLIGALGVFAEVNRWPVLDRRVWPNPVARGSHRAEVRFPRSWLERRIRWIDRNVGRL